ncbi:Hypothetical_protein [Hexamita inflata]|uniref:Hypothetical_protein n=1 Tax=Hexamita inflata TaxID=28002 RepID=A0AA86QMS2_9EUKA|nr:Hypothetical protein HINF_LOCUS44407 [Hexamita inflata]
MNIFKNVVLTSMLMNTIHNTARNSFPTVPEPIDHSQPNQYVKLQEVNRITVLIMVLEKLKSNRSKSQADEMVISYIMANLQNLQTKVHTLVTRQETLCSQNTKIYDKNGQILKLNKNQNSVADINPYSHNYFRFPYLNYQKNHVFISRFSVFKNCWSQNG